MTETITRAHDVPQPGSPEVNAVAALLGVPPEQLTPSANGVLVGWAAGKAAAMLPPRAMIVRVVVVAEVSPEGT